MDSQNPASLSSQVHKILREEFSKFIGVIITDDLAMDGVRNLQKTQKLQSQVKAGKMICCAMPDFEGKFQPYLKQSNREKLQRNESMNLFYAY